MDLSKVIKSYDIRGVYPEQLNEEVAEEIARRFCAYFKPQKIVIGRDARLNSEKLQRAFIKGALSSGINVIDVGLVTTCMLYFADNLLNADFGIMITASHNPVNYGGIKINSAKNGPIFKLNGINKLLNAPKYYSEGTGKLGEKDIKVEYLKVIGKHFEGIAGKFVLDTMHGATGAVIKEVFTRKGIVPIFLSVEVDGNFPGYKSPNPTLPVNQELIKVELEKNPNARLGLMWDGDGDRLVVFDDKGRFVSPNYITYLIAELILQENPGTDIILDVRTSVLVRDKIESLGGKFTEVIAGNPFVKAKMREEDAMFGAETTGHYMFKETNYAEDSIIAASYLIKAIEKDGRKLSQIVDDLNSKYFIITETNFEVPDKEAIFERIKAEYKGLHMYFLDGVTLEADGWRANIRASNTEPLIRLNLEARSKEKLDEKFEDILGLVASLGGRLSEH
ncbi:MAG: Phosphomannomutase [candidate division CPR2 bacterium GW2011_GWC1_39_9]|uniref:Phosphomannomutase n=1 Tax=candidate division CPR2 bacterium GW2011_GWC2_39_10 TaxID=1618345 RepID=A0A0G0LM36_UNCC2|nr:MAG: Phosphomannomutase [candidate division CPR2 bacterium GW2011_GWC2_39_10]KKR34076.1 MAG: Phosphomannomutase [candidate division CPR2 bacterium GW2011_GWC1_39_9]